MSPYLPLEMEAIHQFWLNQFSVNEYYDFLASALFPSAAVCLANICDFKSCHFTVGILNPLLLQGPALKKSLFTLHYKVSFSVARCQFLFHNASVNCLVFF